MRDQFIIPTRTQLQSKSLNPTKASDAGPHGDEQECIYLCGNSLGLQPRRTQAYFEQYLRTWATKGVLGHFTPISDSNLVPWLHVDDDVQADMASIVGAQTDEVAVMQTLTANLHLMLASFYRPTPNRYKIILESKAFPSDHYAIESQIVSHGRDPSVGMVLISPLEGEETLSLEHILKTIDEHAADTAVLLLPGIQFYTGQWFDMPKITAHAQNRGILVGWDLAHAAGNVPVKLHEWNVDFAVWCSYKYLNCGPGSIGACFVHERHFDRPRLAGWWGSSKSSRFAMTNVMERTSGASGFQLSNPSVADTTAVRASLDIYKQTTMSELRERSLALTEYLESLLDKCSAIEAFTVITPRNPAHRGAQLSIKLREGLLESVLAHLEENGVVVDERKPDVIRVAPAPLYNTFHDVWRFVSIFEQACLSAGKPGSNTSVMMDGGSTAKGWSEVE